MPVFFHARSSGFAAYSPQSLQCESLERLFSQLGDTIQKVPTADRWDFYYSMAETKTPRKKDQQGAALGTWAKENWIRQEALVFDIDGMVPEDMRRVDDYTDTVAELMGCSPESITVVVSGHGLHFLFFLATAITDFTYFEKHRKLYRLVCDELEGSLQAKNLSGKLDRGVFDYARIMRLPGTENRKRPEMKMCRVAQLSLFRHSIDWAGVLGMEAVPEEDAVATHELATSYRNPDVGGILEECDFLQWTDTHPLEVREPQAYAALSVLARLSVPGGKTGRDLAKERMAKWTNSTSIRRIDPDRKVDQATTASPPRTCASIGNIFAKGCQGCKHFGKVHSPMGIKTESFIASEPDHFYQLVRNKEGRIVDWKPQYGDLLRAFIRDTHYFYDDMGKQLWIWNGTHYQPVSDAYVKSYCETKMNPKPRESYRVEFLCKVKATRLRDGDDARKFFTDSITGLINLKNGVFDIRTRSLAKHDAGYGFRYVLPYAYDPSATSPRFDQYLIDVTLKREVYQKVLLDAMAALLVPGYRDIGATFWWFQGQTNNGKSTLTRLAKALLGARNVVTMQTDALEGDSGRFKLAELDGKLLCVLEETNDKTLGARLMGVLKNLSDGGDVLVERKNRDPFNLANAAKFWFTANDSPVIEDVGKAVQERLVPVPFDLNLRDPDCPVKRIPKLDEMLAGELPGIFNRILDAVAELLQRGEAFKPSESKAIMSQMAQDSDSIERWLAHRVDTRAPMETARLTFAAAYQDYVEFIGDSQHIHNKHNFGRKMRSKLGEERGKPDSRRMPGMTQPVKAYQGLALRPVTESVDTQF